MDPDRLLTLTDAAGLAACSRKALERRVERGSLTAHAGADGQRMVRLGDLMRAGLVEPAPAGADRHPAPAAEAEHELAAMRAALVVTEAALQRVRGEMRDMRVALADAETRAQAAEQELTRMAMDGPAVTPARRSRLRLRTAS